MISESVYSFTPLTLSGQPQQKKRFQHRNLHYLTFATTDHGDGPKNKITTYKDTYQTNPRKNSSNLSK